MRTETLHRIRANPRIFLLISFCIHLFLLSIATLLSTDLRVNRLPSFNIEISLLPHPLPVMAQEKKEKTQIKKAEELQSALPVQTEVKVTQISDPLPHPSQIDEEKMIKDLSVTKISFSSPSDTEVTLKREENQLASKEPFVKNENSPISLFHFRPKESQGTPSTQTGSSEAPIIAMKNPSSSGKEVLLVQPKYAENPKPHYPKEARKKGCQGEVVLRVEVLSNGLVGKIEVKSSSGYEVLDHSALATVKQWKFNPAREGENAVPLWVNIPIRFELQ